MSGALSQGQGTVAAIPVSAGYYPQEGSRALTATYSWVNTLLYNEDLSYFAQAQGGMQTVQSVYVDNSLGLSAITLLISGTGQRIVVPPGSIAWLPAFFGEGARYLITCPLNNPVPTVLIWLNIPCTSAMVWQTTVSSSQAPSSNVTITNASVPVTGSVGVNNFPATQAVSGTVGVNNFPATQGVSGMVAITNLPATQPVSGTVGINNFPGTQPVSAAALPLPAGASTEATLASFNAKMALLLQYEIPYQGGIAMVVGTAQTAQRAVRVCCTVAGNVAVTYTNGLIMILPINTGVSDITGAITTINTSGTTATATYFNMI